MIIICITGLCGAGKSTVSEYFVKKGFLLLRFGQLVLDEVKKRGIVPNEKNERLIREELRKKHGMAAMATLNLPKFDEFIKKRNVIADGLYSFEEYKVLKDHFGDKLAVIAVYAPPQLRYERISKRVMPKEDTDLRNRPFTKEEAASRDTAELENLNKGATIAMADFTLINTKDLKYLMEQIKEVEKEIEKNN